MRRSYHVADLGVLVTVSEELKVHPLHLFGGRVEVHSSPLQNEPGHLRGVHTECVDQQTRQHQSMWQRAAQEPRTLGKQQLPVVLHNSVHLPVPT